MPNFFQFSRWRGQVVHLVSRHAIILAMLGVILVSSALTSGLLGAFAHSPCASGDRTYVVTWGNTLSGIASRYNTTWQRLASYNHLYNANLIFPGQAVCIPSGSRSSGGGSSGGTVSHNQYVNLAQQDAWNVGISANIFVRQINQESGFNPYAISPAGAIGIAQFMPATAASLGVNPYNPVDSLQGAARLMANYVRQYGGNYAKALAAYNAGPGAVTWAVFAGGWNWQVFLPYETQGYIRVILG
jgi:soluble lytic murein transglycosylase-like protein